MNLTKLEYSFLAAMPSEDRELLLFLEHRVVNTRGFFGVAGLSPRPNMTLAAPGFNAQQLSQGEFLKVRAWERIGLIRLWEVSTEHQATRLPVRLGMTYRVELSTTAWRLAWSLRVGQAYSLSQPTEPQPC